METWPQINPEALSALIDERNTLLHDLLEARERLAAVEALCDRTSTPGSGYRQLADHHARLTVAEVRAAARGETTP